MPHGHQDRHFDQLACDRTCASNPEFLELISKMGFHFRKGGLCLDSRQKGAERTRPTEKLPVSSVGNDRPEHWQLFGLSGANGKGNPKVLRELIPDRSRQSPIRGRKQWSTNGVYQNAAGSANPENECPVSSRRSWTGGIHEYEKTIAERFFEEPTGKAIPELLRKIKMPMMPQIYSSQLFP